MAETKAKMKKGITGLAFALATLTTDAQGNQSITYGPIENLVTTTSGGREYSLDPRGDSQSVYADSVKVYGDTINDGYDLNVTLLSVLDRVVQTKWLKMQQTEDGIAEFANVGEMPYFALIIYEDTSDGVGQTSVYYWCQASGRPSDAGKTAEGGNFDWAFPAIPLAATPRPTDKLVRLLIDGKTRLVTLPEAAHQAGVELAEHKIALKVDDEYTLSALTYPANATITWTSGSSSVATVADGVITAEGTGNTIITASITDSGVTYTDTCTVVVSAT